MKALTTWELAFRSSAISKIENPSIANIRAILSETFKQRVSSAWWVSPQRAAPSLSIFLNLCEMIVVVGYVKQCISCPPRCLFGGLVDIALKKNRHWCEKLLKATWKSHLDPRSLTDSQTYLQKVDPLASFKMSAGWKPVIKSVDMKEEYKLLAEKVPSTLPPIPYPRVCENVGSFYPSLCFWPPRFPHWPHNTVDIMAMTSWPWALENPALYAALPSHEHRDGGKIFTRADQPYLYLIGGCWCTRHVLRGDGDCGTH